MLRISLLAMVLLSFLLSPAWGSSILTGAHGNKQLMSKSCRACHKGMKMTIRNEERTCLACHGNPIDRRQMEAAGYLQSGGQAQLSDIGMELRKPYRHPTLDVSGVHRQRELLPEAIVNAARHAECVDCHEPHQATRNEPFRGIRGKQVGNFTTSITMEYELCYKCHGDSANLPAGSTNKRLELQRTNRSFHPVEGEGTNAFVISLKEPFAARKERPGDISVISCGDCHGNDNPNGPSGPHGSNFKGLLVANYQTEDGRAESAFAYALCYRCHERSSILGDESFPYHSLHILGDRGRDLPGTSCYTCHNSHGSPSSQYLIDFNEEVVSPNQSGRLDYQAQGVATRKGSCALLCHGAEHEPKSY